MKLKHRLSITFTAMNLATLSVSFVLLFFLIRRDELRDFDLALDAQAEETARFALLRGTDQHLPSGQGEIPEALALSPSYVALYDAAGRLLSANAVLGPRAPRHLAELGVRDPTSRERPRVEFALDADRLRGVTVPLGRDGQVVLYAMSRRYIDQDLTYLAEVCVALTLGAIALTWLVARGVGRHLSAEVGTIAAVARRVQGGELSARVVDPMNSEETRALARDLDRMIAQLEELMDVQRKFIAHAAHELRSPLATLRGELQLSLRRTRDVAGYQAAIGRALQQAETLSALADDLLTLARVQRDADAREQVPISEVIAGAIDLARALASARGVRFTNLATLDPWVLGAQRDLSRALRNLLDNAVTHSPDGGEVTVQVEQSADAVSVSVVDQGEGVAPAEAPHLFTPFWRGNRQQSGDVVGAGLGLAIAREIARARGGDVELAPSAEGACFVMRLRAAPARDRASEAPADMASPRSGGHS